MLAKSDIIAEAFGMLRISGATTSPDSRESEVALSRLESMIASWQQYNLCLGYNFEDLPDPNSDSGLSLKDKSPTAYNLAKVLAPTYGKVLSRPDLAQAKAMYEGLFSSIPAQREPDPYQPTGSGNSLGYYKRDRFRFQGPEINAPTTCDTYQIKQGQTKDFTIDLTSELSAGNTIGSYEYEDGQGVRVVSISETDAVFQLKCEGVLTGYAPIRITLTLTPSNEVNPVTINFNVNEI